MLHVAFVRSDYAHAPLEERRCVGGARARRASSPSTPRPISATTDTPAPLLVPPPPIQGSGLQPCTHLPLAKDKVRYVGEPIAMIVAESRYIAEDAIRDVVVDIDPLDAVVDLEAALQHGAPQVHEHCRRTPPRTWCSARATTRPPARRADVIVTRRFLYDRGASARDREPRGRRQLGRRRPKS